MLTAIARTPSLSSKAKELIQTAIWTGALEPGAHLVEAQLAGQFRISRDPLREALQALAAEGLVEIQPGRGAFVINPTPDEMEDMIVLRAVLGGMAARHAAACRDDALFAGLERALDGMRAAMADGDERGFFDQHWVLYETVYRASSAVHFKARSSLHGVFDMYVRRMGRPYLPLDRTLRCYKRFAAVFLSGDVDEAEAVVRSQSLIVGFQVLERPIPRTLWGYLTRRILADGSVVPFRPDAELQGPSSRHSTACAGRERDRTGAEER